MEQIPLLQASNVTRNDRNKPAQRKTIFGINGTYVISIPLITSSAIASAVVSSPAVAAIAIPTVRAISIGTVKDTSFGSTQRSAFQASGIAGLGHPRF